MLNRSRRDTPTDSAPPDKIGPYRIAEQLGRGGMGVVYVAEDERLQRKVALKTLGPGSTSERERLLREARAAASLNHPGICQVYDIIEDDDGLWIAMELLEGEGLDAVLQVGRWTWTPRFRWASRSSSRSASCTSEGSSTGT